MRHAGTFQIPTYAIPMLEYGDTTGLTDLDIELVNGFIEARSALPLALARTFRTAMWWTGRA